MSGSPAPSAVGVDIGGTKILGVALGDGDRLLGEDRTETPRDALDPGEAAPGRIGAEVADRVAEVVGRLRQRFGAPGALGVGVPGMLDDEGLLRFAPNLPGATGAHLGRLVGDRLPEVAVTAENDANCAAVAEHRLGAARGIGDFVMVTLGTGIGGGLFVGGHLLRGAFGFAGEVGHMVVDPSGPPCPCGGRGCWERYASGAGLARLGREAAYAGQLHGVVEAAGGDPELVRGEQVTAAARQGDGGALAVLDELGWWVALGLANLTAVFDPARIVIGGGLAEVGELLLAPTRRAFAGLVEGGRTRPALEIVTAAFSERSGAVGAALLAREAAGGVP